MPPNSEDIAKFIILVKSIWVNLILQVILRVEPRLVSIIFTQTQHKENSNIDEDNVFLSPLTSNVLNELPSEIENNKYLNFKFYCYLLYIQHYYFVCIVDTSKICIKEPGF